MRSRAIPGLLFLLLLLGVWADPLFFRRNFIGRDLVSYNLPLEKGIHEAYRNGRLPLWAPEISGGRPLLPNPNAGALYPVRMLLSRIRFPVAMKIFPLLHWAAGGLGVLVLLRALYGASRSAAWLAAVTYVFSGVVVSDVFFPHVLPGMALLPWIVWTAARPGRPAPRIFLLSVLLALDMLAGDVFTIGIAILCAAAWILCEEETAARRALLARLAVATGLAALAALPQILATALWIPETNRAVTGMTLLEALNFSISPYRLLELVVPFPFGAVWATETSSVWGYTIFAKKYVGLFLTLYCGSFAVIAGVVMWRSAARGVRFAKTIVVGSLLLAVLPSLVPEAWRMVRSPIALRNPEKFAVVLMFGLAILSGLALDELRRRGRLPRWIFVTTLPLALLAILATAFPAAAGRVALTLTGTPEAFLAPAVRELPMALTEAAFYWALTWLALELAVSRRRAGLFAGLGILVAVLVAANHRIPWILPEGAIFAPPAFVRYLWKQDPENRYRAVGEILYTTATKADLEETIGSDPGYTEYMRRIWTQHTHALWERGAVFNGDFDNGDLSRVESLRRISGAAASFKDGGPFFESLALRWGTRYRDQVPLPGYARVGGNRIDAWDENPNALPDIRLVRGWTEEPGAVAALKDITNLPRGHVVLETGRSSAGEAPGGSLRISEKSPNRIRLETDAPAPTWLFVLRGFWRHRTVTVDGAEVDVVPAQLAFSAIPIPAGRHRVEWRELLPGASVSWAGPVLYALCLALIFARDRARSESR